MSYAAVGAFGLACPAPGGLSAGGPRPAQCTGGKLASNCLEEKICCPISTYSNATYTAVKGAKSIQYWNEKRVRGALTYFLSATPNGSPNPLDEFAYDQGLAAPSWIMPSIRRAAANYILLFPANRWVVEPNCKPNDCSVGGKTSCWKETGHSQGTPQALATINRLIGITGDTNASWSKKALTVINSAPYSSPSTTHKKYVKPGDLPEKFFLAENGQVRPRIWLTNFLAIFDPTPTSSTAGALASGRRIFTRPGEAPPKRTGAVLLPGGAIPKEQGDQGEAPPPEPEPSISPWLIAGGVAVVGAGAYFLLKK